MRSAAPPKKKKIHLQTYPAGQKTGGCVASLSRHTQSTGSTCLVLTHRAVRLGALRSVKQGAAGLAQSDGGRSVAIHPVSVLPRPPTQSICGDTGRSGGVLWRCSHTQSRTQSNTQFNVRLAQSNATKCAQSTWFRPSPSRFARSPPSRTPKNAHLRPYRDTLSQHFVPDWGDLLNTPSLAAGGEQGGIYG